MIENLWASVLKIQKYIYSKKKKKKAFTTAAQNLFIINISYKKTVLLSVLNPMFSSSGWLPGILMLPLSWLAAGSALRRVVKCGADAFGVNTSCTALLESQKHCVHWKTHSESNMQYIWELNSVLLLQCRYLRVSLSHWRCLQGRRHDHRQRPRITRKLPETCD